MQDEGLQALTCAIESTEVPPRNIQLCMSGSVTAAGLSLPVGLLGTLVHSAISTIDCVCVPDCSGASRAPVLPSSSH